MSWNYRLIRFAEHLALHEVHYDAEGNPKAYTTEPASFVCDLDQGKEIAGAIAMALRDVQERPVLDAAVFGNKS